MKAEILAAKRRNATEIPLVAEATSRFMTLGECIDWTIGCYADGFTSRGMILRLSERWRRMPDQV